MTASSPSANTPLATTIKAAGCTHAGLASRINQIGASRGESLKYDKTSVSHWLNGTQPRPAVRLLIAEALSQKLGRPVALTEIGFVEPESPDCVGRALIFDRHAPSAISNLTELGKMDAERRSLIKAVPFIGAALLGPQRDWLLAVLESEGFQPEDDSSGGDTESARAMIRLFDDMDNRFGGGTARAPALLYLTDTLLPMLWKPRRERDQRQLFTAAAKLTAQIGWMTYDVGGYGLAQRYMTKSLRLCAEGGDPVLGGQILAGLSHLATNLGHPKEGLALARAGIVTAKQSGSPLGLMRIHAMRARAHAALREPREASEAMTEAERALDASRGLAAESEWVQYLDSSYLAIEMASCFEVLGEHEKSEQFARTAAQGASELGRRHTISLAVLASARLNRKNGDLGKAVATANTALRQLDRVSSERSAQALRHFRRDVVRYQREPEVRAFLTAARHKLGPA